ncbi:unnamed protein product [Rotaria sp. Silwood2]|nr:unnamed protein product [Rotaria sp. Silwood2]
MGVRRNEIQSWNEPGELQQLYSLTTTYIGFHRTDTLAAVNMAYTDFRLSTTRSQMLGFDIYFARSVFHTQFKARRDGAVICDEILMSRVLEIENVSNTNAWHQTFDTIYYRHPRQPLRDEFCIKSNEQILKWVMRIEPSFDINVERYALHTEFVDTKCRCI